MNLIVLQLNITLELEMKSAEASTSQNYDITFGSVLEHTERLMKFVLS